MENQNIFELASKAKLRFTTMRGEMSTEVLWDLPLQSKSGFDLDSTAKDVNARLKAVTDESFVNTKANPAKAELELKLEIVKHIIAVKQAENADRLAAAERAAKKTKLIEVLSRKQDAALEQLSPEEIQKQIEELSK